MDYQLVATEIKRPWRLRFEKLISKPVEVDLMKKGQGANCWLYFRRTNPRKFEVYLDEDFKPGPPPNPLFNQINQPGFLPQEISITADDQLSINIEGAWIDCVRFEGVWVEALDMDTTFWDHYLLAEGALMIH